MASNIEIKSFNQILGQMIRKIIAETPLNDINTGSVLLTMLEACASQDFENNVAILNVLELLSVDALRNNDLDSKAAEFGLSRKTSIRASGQVTISNSIVKRSTALYVIKPAPIAGQTVLYVNSTDGWDTTGGALYIGRGTNSFEGPITYTSIVEYPTYSQINLASALQKDHLMSDAVVDKQGQPDRIIAAGTAVKIPANNQSPEIKYSTLRDAVIAAGEQSVSNVAVIAQSPGSKGNAQLNTIVSFDTDPFDGASVTNTSSFSDGRDVETDNELRNRIKTFTLTLARGTSPSILSAVIGVSDADDSKQVASAVLSEPVKVGDPSILYIDDGAGFQPSYAGQSVDVLLKSASGSEEFLQLSNYPLPRPQLVNLAEAPYSLESGMFLRVSVDDEEETITVASSDFVNISAATVSELINVINNQAVLFKARFTNNSNSILLYPVSHEAETIKISSLILTDDPALYANSILRFPVTESSYISLYQNSTRLREKSKAATLETLPFAAWNASEGDNLVMGVDGTPSQDRTFDLSDFIGATSFTSLSLEDWASAFNKKFAGISASATASQTMLIRSNKIGEESLLNISSGDLMNKLFSGLSTDSQGQTAQFELNRQTGNLRILTDIVAGDTISAGTDDAKGFVISSATTSGTYNVSMDAFGRQSEMIVVVDSSLCESISLALPVGSTLSFVPIAGSTMRIMSNYLSPLSSLQPGDYIYLVKRASWMISGDANCGLYRVTSKGAHTIAGTDTYVDVKNDSAVADTAVILDSGDVRAFRSDGFPQIWRGSYASNPPAETINSIIASLNTQLLGVKASVFRSNSIKLTSITENGGSIAVPVSVGNLSVLFLQTAEGQVGNLSHVANKVSDQDLFSTFKRTSTTSANVWLDRYVHSATVGSLTTNSVPSAPPFSSEYSEILTSTGVLNSSSIDSDDVLLFTKGNNRSQVRSIRAILPGDSVGTQQATPRTSIDHIADNDEFMVMRPLDFTADDSVVVIMDKDAASKTVDVKFARTGKVNSDYIPNTTQFSADDVDNEPGTTFSFSTVWGTSTNNTDFKDYAMLMRARNWYASGGVGGTSGKMMIRSAQYGISGEKLRFNIIYPETPNFTATTIMKNTPSWSLFSYAFGSGPQRALALSSGDTVSIKGPYPDSSTNFPAGAESTGDYFDLTFSAGSFGSVVVGDVLSILPQSGFASVNQGQYSILAKNGNTIRIYSPYASVTTPGSQEITSVTTINDIIGSPCTVTWTINSTASLDGSYITLYDNNGSIKMWFDVDNNGTSEPVSAAHRRTIRIATIISSDTPAIVAEKIRDYLVNDSAFSSVFNVSNQVIYTLAQNGPTAVPVSGVLVPSPVPNFSYSNSVAGIADQSIDGKYFLLNDSSGSVAVWFDVGDNGTSEPFHGADRSIKVDGVSKGDSASIVASAIAAAINTDSEFSASSLLNVLTIISTNSENLPNASAGTSGFAVSSTDGSLGTSESISNPGAVYIFPLLGTAVSEIIATINEKEIIKAAAIGTSSLTITKATKEEQYAYVDDSTALAYGHNPLDPTIKDFISLHDGEAHVKSFQNSNPQFTTKSEFTLNGVSSAYAMNSTPNEDSVIGEYFKLVPTTVLNVQHHLTQKALSQLPIVADVNVANSFRNIQIKSKNLGSSGAIEIVGGKANSASTYIIGESETVGDYSGEYLAFKISAYPDTFSVGDMVKLENNSGVKRLSRLAFTDTIDVTVPTSSTADYKFNSKNISISSSSQFAISDVSAAHSRPAGTVFRYTHSGGVSFSEVIAGDLLFVYGSAAGWSTCNMSSKGLPIINVNSAAGWIEVVNLKGEAMPSTAVGVSLTFKICPTPIIKWQLGHAVRLAVSSLSKSAGVVSITTSQEHYLKNGDNVELKNSDNLADDIYGPITVTGIDSFTFSHSSAPATISSESHTGLTIIDALSEPTRYTVEKLGINGLTKLTRVGGDSPNFADSGVAVDDYIVISGNTFDNNNNGRFRALSVQNDSIILMNESSIDELNTVIDFNDRDYLPNWIANSTTLTGGAGTFKNVSVGDWVKKQEDPDSYYRQIINLTPSDPALATEATLGGIYLGSSTSAAGVAYNQTDGHYGGVVLLDSDDISAYEGDSAVAGDSLQVQDNVSINWFDAKNSGSFEVEEVGISSDKRPFIRVLNSSAMAQTNRALSVSVDGFYLIEGSKTKISSYRKIENIAISELSTDQRIVYVSPSDRKYKFSEFNFTKMSSTGKIGYGTDPVTGVDGYTYYTGLLRKVQRIVDGFEPDSETYPGRRAIGGSIEILPPLTRMISISIDVTTGDGVNLSDITGAIKSTIIQYVQSLGVGDDVILSEIIAKVMKVKGVAAVTFISPTPGNERVTIADNEKASTTVDRVSVS